MICRCGHGRQAHRMVYGRKRQPCWYVIDRELYSRERRWGRGGGKRSGALCRCRDYTQAVTP